MRTDVRSKDNGCNFVAKKSNQGYKTISDITFTYTEWLITNLTPSV